MIGSGRGEDEDRINRRGHRRIAPRSEAARTRIAWCIAGTPGYQVGWYVSSHEANSDAKKPGGQTTLPPAASDAIVALRALRWKSGITLRHRSASPSSRAN